MSSADPIGDNEKAGVGEKEGRRKREGQTGADADGADGYVARTAVAGMGM
jgi:hypothetical protein